VDELYEVEDDEEEGWGGEGSRGLLDPVMVSTCSWVPSLVCVVSLVWVVSVGRTSSGAFSCTGTGTVGAETMGAGVGAGVGSGLRVGAAVGATGAVGAEEGGGRGSEEEDGSGAEGAVEDVSDGPEGRSAEDDALMMEDDGDDGG